MNLEDLGLIGNCQYSALVDRSGSVVWCCLPRFDAEPVFGALLDEKDGGRFSVAPAAGGTGTQRYLTNSNVIETVFETPEGRFRVIDFAPRFMQHNRSFRPTQLFRIVEPLAGMPLVRVSCDPRLGWSKAHARRVEGSNHVRFEGFERQLRLTTDIPLSYIDGKAFALTGRRYLALTWGAPIEEPLPALCEHFLTETLAYWERWVKHCTVPPMYQAEVIRSALALKLHCFEDTGAIIAAMTTSIPEAPGSGRTWDYRYCWLRDAYYSLNALRRIGHFEEREQFLNFLVNIAAKEPNLSKLAPLYRIDGGRDLEESVLDHWAGYEGDGPVRIGNAASLHQQHDIYGEMVLALAPIYFDDRYASERSPHTLDLMERLTQRAIEVAGTPDAGIWEYRSEWRPQTFSSLMCWAAADRMATIAERFNIASGPKYRAAADKIRDEVCEQAYDDKLGSFVASYGTKELDAALLQMISLRFLPPNDPRLTGTVRAVQAALDHEGWLRRYASDGMGNSEVAFTICTFWFVEALARVGAKEEARAVFDRILKALTPLGLIAEDYDPKRKRMWGNFPQAYSHVGLIHAAFSASPDWHEVL